VPGCIANMDGMAADDEDDRYHEACLEFGSRGYRRNHRPDCDWGGRSGDFLAGVFVGVIRRYLGRKSLVRPGLGTDINGEEAGWYRWFVWFEIAFAAFTVLAIGAS